MLAIAGASGCRQTEPAAPETLLPHARALQAQARFQDSIAPLQSLLQEKPRHHRARRLLARAYLETGDGKAAASHLERAERAGADPATLLPLRVRALVLQEAYGEALEAATPGLVERADMALLLALAEAHMGLSQVDAAREALGRAIALAPGHIGARSNLFRIAMDAGDHAAAEAHLGNLPDNLPERWLLEGELALSGGEASRARAAYSRVLARHPGHREATQGLAQARLADGDPEGARETLEAALAENPEDPDAHYLLAVAHYQQGERDQAVYHVRETLRQVPVHSPAQRLYGLLNIELKRYEQAAVSLKDYLGEAPGDIATRKLLAAVWLQLEQPWDADDVLAEIGPGREDIEVRVLRAISQLQRGDFSRAVASLGHIEGDPLTPAPVPGAGAGAEGPPEPSGEPPLKSHGDRVVAELLAAAPTADEDVGEAARLARRVIEHPADPAAYRALVERALARGDKVEACSLYRRLLAHGEDAPARAFFDANGCARLADAARRETTGGNALTADPGAEADLDLQAEIARLRAALGGAAPDSGGPVAAAAPAVETARLSQGLVATIASRQVRTVSRADPSAAPVSAALYEIPPELKDQLRNLRDSLPEWVRALNDDGPPDEPRRQRDPGADDAQGAPVPAPAITAVSSEPGALRQLAELGSGVFGVFGWLAGTVRGNQVAAFIIALAGGAVLLIQYLLVRRTHRRRQRHPGDAPGAGRPAPRRRSRSGSRRSSRPR